LTRQQAGTQRLQETARRQLQQPGAAQRPGLSAGNPGIANPAVPGAQPNQGNQRMVGQQGRPLPNQQPLQARQAGQPQPGFAGQPAVGGQSQQRFAGHPFVGQPGAGIPNRAATGQPAPTAMPVYPGAGRNQPPNQQQQQPNHNQSPGQGRQGQGQGH